MNSTSIIVFVYVLGIIGLMILINYIFKKLNKAISKVEIMRLKNEGNKIVVDLAKCSINNYVKQNTKTTILNEINDVLYNPNKKYSPDWYILKLYFTSDYKNKSVQFESEKITVEIESLPILLEQQKETIIYIDKENSNNYYFDIEFINGN